MSKILVVDDEESILTLVTEILKKGGHEVVTANSGKACLEILENEKPDLILMDVMMPRMDGWEVIEEIKKDEANSDIIISMLTVKSLNEDKEKSLCRVDADWHISKPIVPDKLLETVGMLLKESKKA